MLILLITIGTIQLLSSHLRCSWAPMTRPRRSKRRVNSNSDEIPSQSKVNFRASKAKFKVKTPLSPEPPISNISESNYQNLAILGPDFCSVDALDLAPRLLGKFLRRDDVILQITEVEAYRPNDSACHGRFGLTARTAPVFGPGGHAYVYLCYGLHMMLNIVADKEGVGAAVLIRSCAPVSGLKTIQQRRGQITDKPVLLAGPGRVGQALGLSTEWSNHPLFVPGGLELLDGPKPEKIVVGPRVGINYALPEHVNALWRFAVAGFTPAATRGHAGSKSWVCPPIGCIKANVDAHVPAIGMACLGVIFRNSAGNIIVAATKQVAAASPEYVEALAVRYA